MDRKYISVVGSGNPTFYATSTQYQPNAPTVITFPFPSLNENLNPVQLVQTNHPSRQLTGLRRQLSLDSG